MENVTLVRSVTKYLKKRKKTSIVKHFKREQPKCAKILVLTNKISFPDDLGRAVEELVSVMTEEPNQTTAPPQYTNGKPAKE